MPNKDPKKFVQSLDLEFPKFAIERLSPEGLTRALESGDDGSPESFINNRSVISFVSDVPGQSRQDVLNSTLIAQLAANKKYPNDADLIKWFETYCEVLSQIGWTFQLKDSSDLSSSKTVFEMDAAIIELIGAAIGANAVAILKSTLAAFKSLSDSDNKIIAFEKNTHSLNKGSFQVGMVSVKDNAVAIRMGGFLLSTEEVIRQILFFKGSKDKFNLQVKTVEGTLNTDVYDLVRNDIKSKLGISTQKYVAELEIGELAI
jgi:hypothetical protein